MNRCRALFLTLAISLCGLTLAEQVNANEEKGKQTAPRETHRRCGGSDVGGPERCALQRVRS